MQKRQQQLSLEATFARAAVVASKYFPQPVVVVDNDVVEVQAPSIATFALDTGADRMASRRARPSKEKLGKANVMRMFMHFGGNDTEIRCPCCRRNRLDRMETSTWQLGHVCSWAHGGDIAATPYAAGPQGTVSEAALPNLMPLCPPCNMLAEGGGRRMHGQYGGNHFDGLFRAACGQLLYDGRIGRLLNLVYMWQWTCRGLPSPVEDDAETALEFVRRTFSASMGRAGGIEEPGVFAVYERWLEARRTAATMHHTVAVYDREAALAADQARGARVAMLEYRRQNHYLFDDDDSSSSSYGTGNLH